MTTKVSSEFTAQHVYEVRFIQALVTSMRQLLHHSFSILCFICLLFIPVSGTYLTSSGPKAAAPTGQAAAPPVENESSPSRQVLEFRALVTGQSTSGNISTVYWNSSASTRATTSSDFKTVPLSAGSGGTSLQTSDLATVSSKSSFAKQSSNSEWHTSLTSKPGTSVLSDVSSSEFTVGSTRAAILTSTLYSRQAEIPFSSSSPPSTFTLLWTPKVTSIIYETSTTCDEFHHGPLTSTFITSPSLMTSQPAQTSATITFNSEISVFNSSVRMLPSTGPTLRLAPTDSPLTMSATRHQETSMVSMASRITPQNASSSINASSRRSGSGSSFSASKYSRLPHSSLSSAIARTSQSSKIETSTAQSYPKMYSSMNNTTLTAFGSTSSIPTFSKSGAVQPGSSHSTPPTFKTTFRPTSSQVATNTTGDSLSTFSNSNTFYKKISPARSSNHTGGTASSNFQSASLSTTAPDGSASTPIGFCATTNLTDSMCKSSRLHQNISQLSSTLNTISISAIASQTSPPSLSLSTPTLTRNTSAPLTTCGILSRTQPAVTSWTAGACKIISREIPASTLQCASSVIFPSPVTACACPDGQLYERIAGGGDPCNQYTSTDASEFLEATLTCADITSNCIPTSSSVPSPKTTAPPVPDGGQFSVIPTYPSTCNASTITYSSTKPLRTGHIKIDTSIGWGNASSKWEFRAGGGVEIDRMNNTSNPGTSSFSGNPEAASESFTKNADGSWTMKVVPNMPSLSLFAVTSGATKNNKSFPLTVTSVIPCNKPVALQCNDSFSDLTPDQWIAFEVDKFVAKIENDFKATGGPNFFEWFLAEYIGDTIKAPCQVDQEGCQPLSDPCTFVKPGPYQRQAFFVVNAMITLSRYLRYAWLAYEQSKGDLLIELPSWTAAFIVPQKTQTWENVLAITASVFGILSVIGFAAGPFMPLEAAVFTPLFVGAISSGLFGVNSLLNTAINSANVNGAAVAEEIQFDGYAKANEAMNAYVNASEQSLIQTSNAYFLQGTNLTEVLKGGLFVAKTPIAELTDGDFSGSVTAAADWFDKTMIWGLINQAWKSDDNYIVFLPYGPVKWYSGDTRNFDSQTCHDQFLNNGHWNGTIYGSCDAGPPNQPGFAAFMTAQKLQDFNTYNKKSYYEVTYSYQGWNFNANDVFKSSLAGYFQHGFNYNATNIPVGELLTQQNEQVLAGFVNQTVDSPGIFNIPVCVIHDTSFVPACTITDWGNRGDPCYTSPQQCLTSQWVDPKDPNHKQNFTDFVSQNIVSGLQDATTYDNLWM